ncbi:MAG TPA: hypothetical protein PKE64_10340 [Anaerolineae bacterium]|nr:hypothetical protein [Anaerolineae bacterium]HMR64397.1 hypothetical protein [Anaerolineae bacterium]
MLHRQLTSHLEQLRIVFSLMQTNDISQSSELLVRTSQSRLMGLGQTLDKPVRENRPSQENDGVELFNRFKSLQLIIGQNRLPIVQGRVRLAKQGFSQRAITPQVRVHSLTVKNWLQQEPSATEEPVPPKPEPEDVPLLPVVSAVPSLKKLISK